MKKYLLVENFLSEKECEYVIDFAQSCISENRNAKMHRNTVCVDIFDQAPAVGDINSLKPLTIIKQKIFNCVNFNYSKLYDCLVPNQCEVVKWLTKESQVEHLDFDFHHVTSILYLNDDFDGGETYVENDIIKPKKGNLVMFEGNKDLHGVKQITSGIRWTIPTWYVGVKK